MTCSRCEDLDEEVAYLRSELGLQLALGEIEVVRAAFGLTPACARLLLILYRARGRVVTALQLLDSLPPRYDVNADRDPKMIAVHVHRIKAAAGFDLILTAHGQGYYLSPEGANLVALALGDAPSPGPAALHDLAARTDEELRVLAAHIAGHLAHRDGDGGAKTAIAYRRIADRLTGQPRRAA